MNLIERLETYINEIKNYINSVSDYSKLRNIYDRYYYSLQGYISIDGACTNFETSEDMKEELHIIKQKLEMHVSTLVTRKNIKIENEVEQDQPTNLIVNVTTHNNNNNTNNNQVNFDIGIMLNELKELKVDEKDKEEIIKKIVELEKLIKTRTKDKSKIKSILTFILSKGIDVGAGVLTTYLMNSL